MCFSFVHGRLPYENLKPDPVLRSLLMSLPYRKIVRIYAYIDTVFELIKFKAVCFTTDMVFELFIFLSIITDFHKCGQDPCCKSSEQARFRRLLRGCYLLRDTEPDPQEHNVR